MNYPVGTWFWKRDGSIIRLYNKGVDNCIGEVQAVGSFGSRRFYAKWRMTSDATWKVSSAEFSSAYSAKAYVEKKILNARAKAEGGE